MEVSLQRTTDQSQVTVRVRHQYGVEELFFRCSEVPLQSTPDALVPLALIPAMYLGEPLSVHGRISQASEANIGQLQTLLNAFDPVLKRIDVHSESVHEREPETKRGTAAFFSGGVDSFYTALRHRDELDALIFIRGFDFPVERSDIFDAVIPPLREAAKELGIRLIEVETNLKSFSNRFVDWPYHYYGAALATVGHLLGGSFSRFLMAGGYSYALIPANGAHPLLDPLWSSSSVEFVYDGGEATRSQKVALVAASSAARHSLRVCADNPDQYNCGRCKKCLLTMASMRAAGALTQVSTFTVPLDLQALAAMDISHPLYSFRLTEVLEGVDLSGGDPELEAALLLPILRSAYEKYVERIGHYEVLSSEQFIAHNSARIHSKGNQVMVETPRHSWAYAASLTIGDDLRRLAPDGSGVAFIRLRLRVRGGSIGVGITTQDGSAFLDRQEVRPSAAARNVYLRVGGSAQAGELVVQTWNLPVQSTVEIESVCVQLTAGHKAPTWLSGRFT